MRRPVQLPAPVEVTGLVVLGVLSAVLEVLYLPVRAGGTPLPVTALVAAGLNLLLVRASGERTTSTPVAAAPLLAWVLVVLGTAFAGPGGDVLLVNDWRAVGLLVGGVVPPAIFLGVLLGRNAVLRGPGGGTGGGTSGGSAGGPPGARCAAAAGAQSPR